MNILKNIPIFLLLLIMAACSSDTDATLSEEATPVNVILHLSVAGNEATRADALLNPDTNARADEMMKNWKVIVADANDKVVNTFEKSDLNNLETDEVTQRVTLIKGNTYHFYSFANLSWSDIGFTDVAPATGTDVSVLNTRTFSINGNDFALSSSSGIPMSNKQAYTVEGTDNESLDLIVVRMLAKMEFRFTNATTSALTVTGITLSEITSNVADNICLLPKYQTGEELNGPDDMAAGDLLPNLPTGVTKADFTKVVNLNVEANAQVVTTFYLNESQVTEDSYPGYFVITLSVTKDGGNTTEQRYALLTWKKIARNDYRTIPIRLDDYSLEIIPYDFPAIGVYPASVREEDGKFTCTFHAGGDFYIVPRVKQLSTGEVVAQTLWDVYSSDGTTPITDESLLTPTGITNEDMYITDNTLRYDADGRWSGGTSTNYSKYFKGTFAEEQYGTAEYDFTVKVTNSDDANVHRFLKYKLYLIREE